MTDEKTRMTVYYDATRTAEDDGFDIVTTEKTYWDDTHFLEDGSSGPNIYGVIDEAMIAYGAEEADKATYTIYDDDDQTIEKLITFMAEQGIDLVTDPEFSAWVNHA